MERAGSDRRPGLQVGRALALLAGLVAGIALGVVGFRQVSRAASEIPPGAREATGQETVTIGDRAVAVLEAGASVRWRELGGTLVVEQNAGDVFYRVDGPPFHVRTPFAVVRAAGTCFQVSVQKDAPEAELLVTAFEGRLQVQRGGTELELAPGERGLVAGGGAPMLLRRGEPLRTTPTPMPTPTPAPAEPTAAQQQPDDPANGRPSP